MARVMGEGLTREGALLFGRRGILGSGVLIDSLMRRDLIDEYVLLIHPLVLGSGRRLFPTAYRPRYDSSTA
jgi:dihydrofolate reductase